MSGNKAAWRIEFFSAVVGLSGRLKNAWRRACQLVRRIGVLAMSWIMLDIVRKVMYADGCMAAERLDKDD